MPYFVLQSEMLKRHITVQSIAELLCIRRGKVTDKLTGGSSFSVQEAVWIRDAFFPDMEIGLLFDREENDSGIRYDAGKGTVKVSTQERLWAEDSLTERVRDREEKKRLQEAL